MRNIIIGALISLSLVLMPAAASAQLVGPQGERLTPHLVLARMCTHESSMPQGLDTDGDHVIDQWVHVRRLSAEWGGDCYLIHAVLLRGAQRMREANPEITEEYAYVRYAIEYSRDRLIEPQRACSETVHDHCDNNRWAAFLMPGSAAPQDWPAGARWSSARWHWVWNFTGDVVAMTLDDLAAPDAPLHCADVVHDWGGTMDGEWAASHGREIVECEGLWTANTAYQRPALMRRREEEE